MGEVKTAIRLLLTAPALSMPEPAFAADVAPQVGDLAGSSATTGTNGTSVNSPDHRDIIVKGLRDDGLIEGILSRDELSEADIEAMGLDSVGDILEEMGINLGAGGEGPVVLINGELSSSSSDIADLPPEALRRIQLLPPRKAVAFGATRGRPVINVVLKRKFRQATALGEGRATTLGGGEAGNAELRWTAIRGGNRDNISVKFTGTTALFESEREILAERDDQPFSFSGIVLPSPSFQEVDPALSLLAGKAIVQADVPAGKFRPNLADFVATAGLATAGDLGPFRTLLPRTRQVSLNATFARRLGPRTNVQFYLRGDYSTARSFNGVTPAILILPATSTFSPFSNAVTISRFLGDPLEQALRGGNFDLGGTFARRAGAWQLSLNTKWVHGETDTSTDRGIDVAAIRSAVTAGTANPFAALPADLVGRMITDPGNRRRDQQWLQANASGPLFSLPAGAVTASLLASGTRERSLTRSGLRGVITERRQARDEGNVRGGLVLPLLGDGESVKSPLGTISLLLSASARSISSVGTFGGYGYGFDWEPVGPLRIEAGFDRVQVPPTQQVLTDPLVVRENVRVFDFIRNETAEVRYITGGNPGIATERRDAWSVNARLRPSRDFELQAGWTRENSRDAQSALPPPNAEVQSAFSDRYRRDGSGRLVEVDGRLVSFASVRRDEFAWGFSLRRHVGGGSRSVLATNEGTDDGGDDTSSAASRDALRKSVGGVRFNASARHVWTLSATRQARSGLPQIDLLAGGAAGYGGGMPRHRVEFRTGAAAGGFGVQASGSWTGSSEILAGQTRQPGDLTFSSLIRFDLRAFADLGRALSGVTALQGTRLTLGVDNLFNRQVIVRDRSGTTPLSYQRYLLDPLGRVISVGLRKKF